MDEALAAEILIDRATVETDLELAEAMLMGAHALQKDSLYKWVNGDLRDWLAEAGK